MTQHRKHGPVQPLILSYLMRHANQRVLVDDIATSCGFTRGQVQSVLARLLKNPESGVSVIVPGTVYRFDEAAPKDTTAPVSVPAEPEPTEVRMYEEVGITRNDEVIVRDADGTLWKLTDL